MQTLNEKPLSKRMIAVVLLMAIATVLALSLFVMVQPVFADIGDEVASGISDITATVKKVVNPIAITAAVICGIFLILGSDPASLKKVKTWLIAIVGGLLLVNLAQPLVEWASELGA